LPTASVLNTRITLETVQWTKLSQIEDLPPINDADYGVLEEIRQVLLRHGFEKRFGVCLLHKHFDIQPGEAFLEQSDEESRTSTISVVSEEVAKEAMETAWSFSSGDDIKAGRNCRAVCLGFGQTGHASRHQCVGTI
jgi:hypothetical protein